MSVDQVLVATDGSEMGQRAVGWAASLAARLGAGVVLAHVFEPLAHLGGDEPVDLAALREQAGVDLVQRWSAPLVTAGLDFDAVVVEGKPADAIAALAAERGADLVVVGARGLSPVRRLVMGSTSQRLPQVSTVPVVIIPVPA